MDGRCWPESPESLFFRPPPPPRPTPGTIRRPGRSCGTPAGFFVDCATANQAGCTEVPDPANPTWATRQGFVDAASFALSSIYLPSDPRFHTVDHSWQAPADRQGKLTHVTYPSPGERVAPGWPGPVGGGGGQEGRARSCRPRAGRSGQLTDGSGGSS